MQQGLNFRRGRLSNFVRGHSDGNANYNTTSPKPEQLTPEKRSATPNNDAYIPSRQELAEFARLPLPEPPVRNVAGGSPKANGMVPATQPRLLSPLRRVQQSPARRQAAQPEQDEPRAGIFSGSQLGDNFMNSGLSTPINHPEELVAADHTPNAKAENNRLGRQENRKLSNRNHAPRATDNETHAFAMAEDGRLSVVPDNHGHQPRRHKYHPSHVQDGFYNDDLYGLKKQGRPTKGSHDRPTASSRGQSQSKLPMRGMSVGRSYATQAGSVQIKDEIDERFIETDNGKLEEQVTDEQVSESIIVHDSDDDDFGLYGEIGDLHVTPRPKRHNGLGLRSLREEDSAPSRYFRHAQPQGMKRRHAEADYDDKLLSGMTYKDLQDEPFDAVPDVSGLNGRDSAAAGLPQKLDQHRQQGEREQRQLFSSMSIEEWEESGDWFVDQFSSIMTRLRDARRDKRCMIKSFETEAAEREETIRSRSDAIERKLDKMRQDGQKVVGDQSLS